ncbi:hypothetical protein OS493_010607 [Desmophyllum pertusum]|uniref:Uncharacterized protein n=1 Tax=Desmophyllum pertusum TaxID=174260 RepID=A0A9W9ZUH7_9CNID|nr:hypothetical protein OS493_010607 [Desmophyllum pertusum]
MQLSTAVTDQFLLQSSAAVTQASVSATQSSAAVTQLSVSVRQSSPAITQPSVPVTQSSASCCHAAISTSSCNSVISCCHSAVSSCNSVIRCYHTALAAVTQPSVPVTQSSAAVTQPSVPVTQSSAAVTELSVPVTQSSAAVTQSNSSVPVTQSSAAVTQPSVPVTQSSAAVTEPPVPFVPCQFYPFGLFGTEHFPEDPVIMDPVLQDIIVNNTFSEITRRQTSTIQFPRIEPTGPLKMLVAAGKLKLTNVPSLTRMPSKSSCEEMLACLRPGTFCSITCKIGHFNKQALQTILKVHSLREVKCKVTTESKWLAKTIVPPNGKCLLSRKPHEIV